MTSASVHPAPAGLHRLMDRYLDGDERAFAALHTALTPRLRAFVMHFVRDSAAAEDLVQATWLKAHLARERFEARGPEPDGAVQAWYFTIARNLALDHLRGQGRERKRREPGEVDREILDGVAAAEPTIEDLHLNRDTEQEIAARVQAALAQLPASQREIVEMHKLQGMSMAEVAARLQIREGAARVRAHRAYKALARWLGPALQVFAALLTAAAPGGPR